MTEHDDMAPGEIRRGFERIEKQLDAMQLDVSVRYHELANKMTVALGPLSELRYRMEQVEKDVTEVAAKVRSVEVRAAAVAGGVSVVAFLIKFLLGK